MYSILFLNLAYRSHCVRSEIILVKSHLHEERIRQLNKAHQNASIGEAVSVEFLKLRPSDTEYDDEGLPYRHPVGSNLVANGVAEVHVDSDEPDYYGFRITNKSGKDLYPSIYYLDNSDLSIGK